MFSTTGFSSSGAGLQNSASFFREFTDVREHLGKALHIGPVHRAAAPARKAVPGQERPPHPLPVRTPGSNRIGGLNYPQLASRAITARQCTLKVAK